MTTLKINNWAGAKYSSKADLFEAGQKGILDMGKQIEEFGTWYSFFKNSKQVAKFYQDHTFGFCTQPYGIKLQNI